MTEKTNAHVERLARYLPFSPAHDQIFEEFQQSDDSLDLPTRALTYAVGMIEANAKMIVLTGDAGHGKTHLCRRLIQRLYGYDEDRARKLINEKCDGKQIISAPPEKSGAPNLRIFKDFSEVPFELASDSLETALEDQTAVTVVCANEGRLRAVLEATEEEAHCREILNAFIQSFRDGLASRDGRIHVINLNFQSIAAPSDSRSLVESAIHDWTKGNRWKACDDCSARDGCPILHNRNLLAAPADQARAGRSSTRRQKIEALFATLERLGAVITIRDMLMIVAYLLTSGLRCPEVHKKVRLEGEGWQSPHVFYNLLFQPPPNVPAEKVRRIPVLLEMKKLDPGRLAHRGTDEQIINDQQLFPSGELDLCFRGVLDRNNELIDAANGIDDILGNPRNRKERHAEAEQIRQVIRSLRRRTFFDDESVQSGALLTRLGFVSGGSFLDVIGTSCPSQTMAKLKKKLLAGLHTIQGLQLSGSQTELYLVDPAFGNATSHAAIIADTIPGQHIQLIPLARKWEVKEEYSDWILPKTVDWIDRDLVLRVSDDEGRSNDLLLDLMTFDCIVRAAGGYVAEQFYEHDVRRISSFLGQLAERRKRTSEQITLFLEGQRYSVSLDSDLIQVGGGA